MEIQLDAIEAVCEVLDQLNQEDIEQDFVPCILNNLDIQNQNQIEIVKKMAEIFGKIVYKMSLLGIHLKYRKELIEYFKEICAHK